ncbi:conserved hypothetical protein [Cronobacter universalis NCTC 9529]|nr:conserved hypothetical protein [Cronobacter universalis NCTC 9529]
MRAHFAAVDGVFLAHTLFDKRMTGFRHDRRAARALHHVNGVPGQTRIVNDLRAGVFFEERFGQQTDNVVALDKLPGFVEQEAAVEIAVKGDAHIRAMFDNRVAGVVAALRQQRVRNTVREVAVRGVVNLNELHRHVQRLKARFDGVHHRAGCAVAGVNHKLQRREVFHVDVTEQVIDIGVAQVDFFVAAAGGFIHRREVVRFGKTLHVAQAGIAANRARAFANQLHAVVVHRVVARGHFNAAVHAQMERREVNFFGAGQADIQHVDARVLQPFRQRQLQRFAGQTHIAAEHNGFRFQELAIGAADTPRDIFI